LKDCLFCEKDDPEKNKVIFENELAYSRWDNFPIGKGHAQVVPKRHVVSFFDSEEKEIIQMFELLKKTRELIHEKFHPDGYNLGVNEGEVAGRRINHLHIQIVPRYFGDQLENKIKVFVAEQEGNNDS
jgi:diadenosine tetraphosphate (Ap4A) HIT family hydrolase